VDGVQVRAVGVQVRVVGVQVRVVGVQVRAVGVQVRESIGPRLPEEAGPNVELTNRYGSGTSAVTLPISSNSVFEVYSFT